MEVRIIEIIISGTGNVPIYEQIVGQIKAMIISQALKEGEALPSMRTLASELRISVITTKRAYEELERQGYITSMTGKGSFVSGKNLDFIREEQYKMVEDYISKACACGKNCNLSYDELVQMLEITYKGE